MASGNMNISILEEYKKEDLIYDFLYTKRWMKYATCHAIVKNPYWLSIFNKIYIGIVFVLLLSLEVMAMIAFYNSMDKPVLAIESLHTCMVIVLVLEYMVSASYNHERLEQASAIIRTGVFQYEHEPMEYFEIRKKGITTVKKFMLGFSMMINFSGFALTIIMPIFKIYKISGDHSNDPVDPYLSQPFVWPFNTRATTGYFVANGLNVIFIFYVATIVIVVIETYVSCAVQLIDQFKILNHALVNIESKAIQLFGNSTGQNSEDLYKNKEFQDCIYGCLGMNILHHRALIRMKGTFENYIGVIFFSIVYLQSVVMAANICLLLEKPTTDAIIAFSGILLVEGLSAFIICYYGEKIRIMSGEVFFSLYCTPWIRCDKRFRKQVLYLMMHCRKHVSIKVPFLNIVVCMEAFGNVVSAIYSVISLLRQT